MSLEETLRRIHQDRNAESSAHPTPDTEAIFAAARVKHLPQCQSGRLPSCEETLKKQDTPTRLPATSVRTIAAVGRWSHSLNCLIDSSEKPLV